MRAIENKVRAEFHLPAGDTERHPFDMTPQKLSNARTALRQLRMDCSQAVTWQCCHYTTLDNRIQVQAGRLVGPFGIDGRKTASSCSSCTLVV
eukprot:2147702-Amphidinium_carterae.1